MDKEIKLKAEKIIKKLIKRIDSDPYDVQAYYNLGVALNESHSFEQAEELFKKAIEIFSKNQEKSALMHYGLGNVYYTNSLYTQALSEFEAVKSNKLKQDTLLMIGQTYFAQEKYQKALVYALTVSEKSKNNIDSLLLIASCFLALGDLNNAQKYYQKVIEIDDENVQALFQLGVIALSQSGDAKIYFEKVKDLDYKYFEKMQTRLTDIQRFLLTQKKEDSK